MIDFSRSVRNKNAKSVQGFQKELYSPKETPILIFFLELTIELAVLDYLTTIRGNPSASVTSSASQQGLSRSYYNVANI